MGVSIAAGCISIRSCYKDVERPSASQLPQRSSENGCSLHITEIAIGDLGDIITFEPEKYDQDETSRAAPVDHTAGLINFMI